MKRPRNTLKKYFEKGKKPTEEQFGDTIDSFVHKDDSVPIDNVEGLRGALDSKLDRGAETGLLAEFDKRMKEVENAVNKAYLGMAVTSTIPPDLGAFWYKVSDNYIATFINMIDSSGNPIVTKAEDFKKDGVSYDVTIEVNNKVAKKEISRKDDTSGLATKSELQEVQSTVNTIVSKENISLIFDKYAFAYDLSDITSFPNSGAIVDVTGKEGEIIDLTTNAYDLFYCGFKNSEGVAIQVFHTSTGGDPKTYRTVIPSGAKQLCISKFGNVNTSLLSTRKDYASFETEKIASDAKQQTEVLRTDLDKVTSSVNNIIETKNINLVFDKAAFDGDLNENPAFPNMGAIVDIADWQGLNIELITNAYGPLVCGWKDAAGKKIGTFQTGETAPLYKASALAGATKLYISRYGNFASKLTTSKRQYANIAVEDAVKNTQQQASANKEDIDFVEDYLGLKKVVLNMQKGGYYNSTLQFVPWGNDTSYGQLDVSNYQGLKFDLYTNSYEATCNGFEDANGSALSVFQTGTGFKKYSGVIPGTATNLKVSLYNQTGEDLHPYIIIYTKEKTDDFTPYTKHFDYLTLGSFFEKLIIGKNTPLNLLFAGNSIVNFQVGSDAVYSVDSLSRPRAMYNKETFPYKTWQYLNPGTFNDYTGAMIAEHGNITFIKGDKSTVTKTGTWYSNYDGGTGYNNLGTYFSAENRDIQEFFHSKTAGDSMEILLPTGTKGFSVVGFRFNDNKTYDGFTAGASTMKIYIGGVLKDTVSLSGEELVYFDYPFDTPLTSVTTIKIENAENKWLPIWGFEHWSNNCVRPIKLAWSATGLGGSWSRLNKFLINNTPDMIIHEAQLINERFGDVGATMIAYNNYIKAVKSNNIPLVFLVTHNMSNPALNQSLMAIALINVLKANNVPYVNVFKYLDDKFSGGRIPDSYYLDGTHLSTAGHKVYVDLIKHALDKRY
ncbi:hypothetical protein IQN75_10000 [Elizabethkingia anophelis]|uniref:SGNH/GDSL hydrolase family protein n=1 Tax=Elizabethkingia anophelis TaxID=1117645 RepID=UPI0018807178|nr:hypothetical protein [Elizabethkingia anophelis]MBE9393739.1 hypothetical protein [Elizabethkingia anophelis]MBE9405660.1 hypothetical protein [Elizabethkingia anophelis]